MTTRTELAKHVSQGAQSVRVTLFAAEVEATVTKILARLDAVDAAGIRSYAYVAGRNKGIETLRRRTRLAQRAATAAIEAEVEARRAKADGEAMAEFFRKIVDLANNPPRSAADWRTKCEVVAALVAGGGSVAEAMAEHGVSRDVVYQWRKRVTDKIMLVASDNLRRWLKHQKNNTNRR